jgi:hypothetical protein
MLGPRSFRLITVIACVLGVVLPESAGAAPVTPATGSTLVFTSGKAQMVAGQLAVPVKCLANAETFCSGVLTLSRAGQRASVPFSVQGGHAESIFVPLSFPAGTRKPLRVNAVAATTQPAGAPVSSAEVLLVE